MCEWRDFFFVCFLEIRPHTKRKAATLKYIILEQHKKRGNFYVCYALENNFAKLCGTIHQLIALIRRTFSRSAINIEATSIHLALPSHRIAFAILSHRTMRAGKISGAKKGAINKVKWHKGVLAEFPLNKN